MYRRLTEEDRIVIHTLLKANYHQAEIARQVGCHPSSISRELNRNRGGRGYRIKQAQRQSEERRLQQHKPRIVGATWRRVERLLRKDWSPEQINARLCGEGYESVSPERIYQYVYTDKAQGGDLHTHLRCQKKRRKRYGTGGKKRGQIKEMRPIESRPKGAENRSRLGHLEGDLVMGKRGSGAILTLVDRKSRFTVTVKIKNKSASETLKALKQAIRRFPHKVHTITFDRGKEFALHKKLEKSKSIKSYFANAYASWERGSNENTNGLLRQYFPKGSSFTAITQSMLRLVENKLNNRPRKVLGFKTPREVAFAKSFDAVALAT